MDATQIATIKSALEDCCRRFIVLKFFSDDVFVRYDDKTCSNRLIVANLKSISDSRLLKLLNHYMDKREVDFIVEFPDCDTDSLKNLPEGFSVSQRDIYGREIVVYLTN